MILSSPVNQHLTDIGNITDFSSSVSLVNTVWLASIANSIFKGVGKVFHMSIEGLRPDNSHSIGANTQATILTIPSQYAPSVNTHAVFYITNPANGSWQGYAYATLDTSGNLKVTPNVASSFSQFCFSGEIVWFID